MVDIWLRVRAKRWPPPVSRHPELRLADGQRSLGNQDGRPQELPVPSTDDSSTSADRAGRL